jgi:hypothetical protein
MRILIRGGSIAAGHGVARGFASILAEMLMPDGHEVINRSRYRETSFDGVWSFEDDIEPFRPDILLLNFAVDDAFHPVYRSEFQENHVRMIKRARELCSPVVMLATSHMLDDPYENDALNIYYRSLKIVASDLECLLVPVHLIWAGHIFEGKLKNSDLTLSDSRYPNGDGHMIFTEAIMKHLDKYIVHKPRDVPA